MTGIASELNTWHCTVVNIPSTVPSMAIVVDLQRTLVNLAVLEKASWVRSKRTIRQQLQIP